MRTIPAKRKKRRSHGPTLHSPVRRLYFTSHLRRRILRPNPRSPAQLKLSTLLASPFAQQPPGPDYELLISTDSHGAGLQEEEEEEEAPEGEPGVQDHRRHPRRYHLARAVQVDLLLQVRLHALARPHLLPVPKQDAAVHRRLLLRRLQRIPLPKKARYFTNLLSRQRYPLVDPSLSFLPNCDTLGILDTCNGLLLCRCWKAAHPLKLDYVVCNPTTEKWMAVPATDWSRMVSVARLGFDPAVSSHFHVFEFIDEESWGIAEDELDGDCCGRIETLAIYSSKAAAWKYQTVEHDPFVIAKNSVSAFFNGILHVAALYKSIVAVDVEGANWWLVDVPELPYYPEYIGGIFPSQGRLYFADSDGSKLSIWVLEDYVTGKWILKHTVSHLQLFGRECSSYANNYSVVSIHPEHSLVFIVGGVEKTLMSYDMDSRQLCFICQLGPECKAELPGCGEKTPFYPHVPLFLDSLVDMH